MGVGALRARSRDAQEPPGLQLAVTGTRGHAVLEIELVPVY